jgi:serpin B
MKSLLIPLLAAAVSSAPANPAPSGNSINAFGLDLHHQIAAAGGNLVTSPWSIQTALAMTWAGADGKTKAEMAKVLHFGDDEAAVHEGLAGIAADLRALAGKSQERVNAAKKHGGSLTPLEINAANRLFGQEGYPFKKAFLTVTESTYGAPLELLNFGKSPEAARTKINNWVETQTKDRIKELIPTGIIDGDTRLVLTNAVYLKAPWAEEFGEEPAAPFYVNGSDAVKVSGLVQRDRYGYMPIPGGAAVTVPYAERGLQFVILLPDERNGLAAMEKKLTAKVLTATAQAPGREVVLHFPKFKLEPERVMLAEKLVEMGMPTAFDRPEGSADFSRMAPRKPNDYLCISHVIHKAFIAVDKYGTEAAAATAVVMPRVTAAPVEPEKPLEVRVDRPFAFAIQHVASGACLFLGRVTDPR